jgi:hypothetical protein
LQEWRRKRSERRYARGRQRRAHNVAKLLLTQGHGIPRALNHRSRRPLPELARRSWRNLRGARTPSAQGGWGAFAMRNRARATASVAAQTIHIPASPRPRSRRAHHAPSKKRGLSGEPRVGPGREQRLPPSRREGVRARERSSPSASPRFCFGGKMSRDDEFVLDHFHP